MDELALKNVKAKLRWAQGGEFSVYLTPEDCKLLLEVLEEQPTGVIDVPVTTLGSRMVTGPDGVTTWTFTSLPALPPLSEPYIGDPGDEHHDR